MLYQTSGCESRRGKPPVAPRSRLRASGEILPSERSVESPEGMYVSNRGSKFAGPMRKRELCSLVR